MAFSRPTFRGTLAFSAAEARVQLHEGLAIFTSMITQAVVLIFVWVLARDLLAIAVFGAILFSMFAFGQRVLNEAAYVRVDHKLNELYLASPLTPESYFLGIAIGVLAAYLGPTMILVALAEIWVGFTPLLAVELLLTALAVWIFSCSMGYVLSTLFRDMRAIWSYASILYNLFGVLPPVFYPIGYFPSVLRPVALAMPPSAASALIQNVLSPGVLSNGEVVFAAVSLAVTATGMLLFALVWARRSAQEG